jgi:tripartite-type tricarboxylate transporter receptor subunit TctC
MHRRHALATLVVGAFASFAALAQGAEFPTRALRLVVPYPAGGGTDIVARPIAQRIGEALGKPVVVENKPGASGLLGTDAVAKSAADGHTLLFTVTSPVVMSIYTYNKLPYNPKTDLQPVAQVSTVPLVLLVNASVPADDLKGFLAYAKSKPKSLSFGSYGTGSVAHVAGEYLNRQAGLDLVHVPYKGTAPALQDLVGGQIVALFGDVGSARPFLKSGQLKAIAVAGPKRALALPDVPTFAEQGVAGMEPFVGWFGVFVPAATPKPIVARLSTEVAKALKAPEVNAQLVDFGSEPTGTTPERTTEVLRNDWARWERIFNDIGGIKLD